MRNNTDAYVASVGDIADAWNAELLEYVTAHMVTKWGHKWSKEMIAAAIQEVIDEKSSGVYTTQEINKTLVSALAKMRNRTATLAKMKELTAELRGIRDGRHLGTSQFESIFRSHVTSDIEECDPQRHGKFVPPK